MKEFGCEEEEREKEVARGRHRKMVCFFKGGRDLTMFNAVRKGPVMREKRKIYCVLLHKMNTFLPKFLRDK